MNVASLSPWFAPTGAVASVKTVKPDVTPTWEREAIAAYLQDAAVGNAGAITSRKVVRTPIKVSKQAVVDYCADMDAQWRHRHINKLRAAARSNGGK